MSTPEQAQTGAGWPERWVAGALLAEGLLVCLLSIVVHPLFVVLLVAVSSAAAYMLDAATRRPLRQFWGARWRTWWQSRRSRRGWRSPAVDLLLVVVVVGAAHAVGALLIRASGASAERSGDGTLDDMAAAVAGHHGMGQQLAWIALVVVLGPLCEELVFRGYALRVLVEAVSRSGRAAIAVPVAVVITVPSFALTSAFHGAA